MNSDYIKNILILENPVKSITIGKMSRDDIDVIFDGIADTIHYIIEDGEMGPSTAFLFVLSQEFGHENLDNDKLTNCYHRLAIFNALKNNAIEELSR